MSKPIEFIQVLFQKPNGGEVRFLLKRKYKLVNGVFTIIEAIDPANVDVDEWVLNEVDWGDINIGERLKTKSDDPFDFGPHLTTPWSVKAYHLAEDRSVFDLVAEQETAARQEAFNSIQIVVHDFPDDRPVAASKFDASIMDLATQTCIPIIVDGPDVYRLKGELFSFESKGEPQSGILFPSIRQSSDLEFNEISRDKLVLFQILFGGLSVLAQAIPEAFDCLAKYWKIQTPQP